MEKLNRRSVIGLESRLEKITSEAQSEVANMKVILMKEKQENASLIQKLKDNEKARKELNETVQTAQKQNEEIKKQFEALTLVLRETEQKNEELCREFEATKNKLSQVKNELKSFKSDDRTKEFEEALSKEKDSHSKVKNYAEVSLGKIFLNILFFSVMYLH